MTGVFLTVWPINYTNELLPPTKGGWPHITLFYSGSELSENYLLHFGFDVLKNCIKKQFKLLPENVVINEFFESSTNKTRFDVLMRLDKDGVELIEEYRNMNDCKDKVSTNYPHVTHSIHYNREEAEAVKEKLQSSISCLLFEITGFTID